MFPSKELLKRFKHVPSILGSLGAVTFGYFRLGELPLDLRLFLVGFFLLAPFIALCIALRKPPKNRRRPTWFSIALRVLAILLVCVLGVYVLNLTVSYHNIRVFREFGVDQDPLAGKIEFQPSRFPTNLTITVSVPQDGSASIELIHPASWNMDDPFSTWYEQDSRPHKTTYVLENFRRPHVFGIWYKLSSSPQLLQVDYAVKSPEDIRVLDTVLLDYFFLLFLVFGGVACLVACLFFSYRWFWSK